MLNTRPVAINEAVLIVTGSLLKTQEAHSDAAAFKRYPESAGLRSQRRMIETGFSDYRGLTQWLLRQGYRISEDSLWRYGKKLQQRIAAMELAVRQARAAAEVAPGRADEIRQAVMRLIEGKILAALSEIEELPPQAVVRLAHAVADMARAALSQQRRADQVTRGVDELQRAAPQPEKSHQPKLEYRPRLTDDLSTCVSSAIARPPAPNR